MIQFSDKVVPYEVFIEDLAYRVVRLMKEGQEWPEYISQRKAYERFGRANVERWRREQKLTIRKRPGKIEISTLDLRKCQAVEQDYFQTTVVRRT